MEYSMGHKYSAGLVRRRMMIVTYIYVITVRKKGKRIHCCFLRVRQNTPLGYQKVRES